MDVVNQLQRDVALQAHLIWLCVACNPIAGRGATVISYVPYFSRRTEFASRSVSVNFYFQIDL